MPVTSVGAPRFLVDPIRLIALPGKFLLDGPWSCPRCRIGHRDDVLDRVSTGAGPAFDEMQVLGGSLEVDLAVEICHVDDQCVPLPMGHRIPPPRADA